MLSSEDVETLAIRERLMRAVVPILLKADGDEPSIGCGTLFERKGRKFLITAAHIAEEIQSDELTIALGAHNSELWTPGYGNLAWANSHDIAVLELIDDRFFAEVERVNYRVFLSDDDVCTSGLENATVYLYGYPAEDTKLETDQYSSTPTLITTSKYSGTPEGLKRHQTDEDLFLHWTSAPGKNLEGISGTAIWTVPPRSNLIWSAGALVCAVETSVAQDKWIRATRWTVVDAILRQHFGLVPI